MRKPHHWSLGLAAATAGLAAFITSAAAQQAPATSKPATPGTATPTAPAAKKVPKPPSECKGLAETVCKGHAGCGWIVPTKPNKNTGKVASPYCRKVAAAAKTAEGAATTAPASAKAKPVIAPKP